MLVVCIRMYPYVTRVLLVCYPYVLVWCFSHDPARHPGYLKRTVNSNKVLFTVLMIDSALFIFNHNHYNFLKFDWYVNCFIFDPSFCMINW